MIVCCCAVTDREWTETELSDRLQLLPENLCKEALRKQQWIDRQLSIVGKLLLLEALDRLNAGYLSLTDLKFNAHHRPYFEAGADFSISHSGNLVTCCATTEGKIGADIEQIEPVDFDDYINYFMANEWSAIRNARDPLTSFFDFWTRKEAILKAIGTGFHTPLNTVDVSNDTVVYDNIAYYIQKINIHDNYLCHTASTIKQQITNIPPLNC